MDDSEQLAAVEAANRRFYEALESMDLAAMAESWLRSSEDVCVHPGWAILFGWPAVRASWAAIFVNTAFMRFLITDTNARLLGDVARVVCVENVFSVAGGREVHSQVAATNLYVRRGERWLLTLHHGSPIATSVSSHVEDAEVN